MDNIGLGTIDKEYKIFRFNPLKITPEDAIIYLSNGKFIFNTSVIDTIKNYLELYLPKYISSYFNSQSNLLQGELYSGISDNGCISGIPFLGNLSSDFINNYIDKIFFKLLKFPNDTVKKHIKSNLHIEIIKLNKNFTDLNEPNYIYNEYIEQLKSIKYEHYKYKNKKIMWGKMFDTNILKLCDMINDDDTRKIIWNYIKEKTNYSKISFKNKYSYLSVYCDVPDYWEMMTKIKTNFKFKPLEPRAIVNVKFDTTNIYYWITQWKDSKINMLKKAKPKGPRKLIDSSYPIFLLSQSSKMIPQWIKSNPKLNLYVIEITIKINKHYSIEYKDLEGKWKKSYRTMKNGQPIPVPC